MMDKKQEFIVRLKHPDIVAFREQLENRIKDYFDFIENKTTEELTEWYTTADEGETMDIQFMLKRLNLMLEHNDIALEYEITEGRLTEITDAIEKEQLG